MHNGAQQAKRTAKVTGCSHVQDGSTVDLLEELQKDRAHLPVHDVLSIFVQVLHTHISCTIFDERAISGYQDWGCCAQAGQS